MNLHARIIKGDIVYPKSSEEIIAVEDGFIILFGNLIKGIYKEVPEEYSTARLLDFSNKLIFPSFNNHLVILNSNEESSYEKVDSLWNEGVLRFNTLSNGDIENSYKLMDYIEDMGLGGYFSHNRPNDKYAMHDLEEFSVMSANVRILVKPYIYIEHNDKNLDKKTDISKKYNLGIIGEDLSCNNQECANALHPELSLIKNDINEGMDYYSYNPFETVDSSIRNKLKELMEDGKLGLYTGEEHSVLETIRYEIENNKIFNLSEMFYMATELGGKFFGKVGKFEEGYSFDAIILEDESKGLPLKERLKNYLLSGKPEEVFLRYVYGMKALGK